MDSLYGGHQGNSFVLSAAFASYGDMVTAFKKGANFTEVWYGEYCLIDTKNKNHPDNGKIYKRGFNYQDEKTGGAEYLGQIVGPKSGTPYFQLDTIPAVKKHTTDKLDEFDTMRYPIGKDSSGKYICSDGKDGKPLATFAFDKNVEQGLVPGKYVENGQTKYNDNIKYTWVNISRNNEDRDSWFYVGWQNVYTVIDYAVHQNSPYDAQGNIIANGAQTITRVDTQEHPYYEKWDIGLPKGIKGDTLRNLRVITPTAENRNNIYAASAITVNNKTGETVVGSPGYTGIDDDIAAKRQIVVFDYYIYDKKLNPTPIMIYLGDWNIIKDVQVANDGTLTVTYTHQNSSVFSKRIQWISSISLTTGNGSAGGAFTVNYNNGATPFRANLTWIKDIQINKTNGTVTYTYAGTDNGRIPSNGIVTVPNLVKWVTSTSLNKDTGRFEINFNDNTQYSNILTWVKDIQINESNGDIIFNTTTGDKKSNARLKILTRAETSANGTISLIFNTGEKITLKNFNADTDYHIKNIEDIRLLTGISDDKRIQIKYNTNSSYTSIGNPINYIENMVVRPSDFHLFVLFNDPTHRAKTAGVDSNGVSWIDNQTVKTFANVPDYGSGVCWRDYGAIKDQSGILIGFNVSYEEVANSSYGNILSYLQNKYPAGLTGEQNIPGGANTKAKIVTYSPNPASSGNQQKEFYAFDYNTKKWYYLGTISDSAIKQQVKLLRANQITDDEIRNLRNDGVMVITNNFSYSDSPIPQYWKSTYNWGA